MAADPTYATVIRRGKPGIIQRVPVSTADPKTGVRFDVPAPVIRVRRMHKEPTTNARMYRAKATDQDIGDTTFIMTVRDVKRQLPELRLTQEAFIEWQGSRYEVVSDVVEDTSYVVTANILNKP